MNCCCPRGSSGKQVQGVLYKRGILYIYSTPWAGPGAQRTAHETLIHPLSWLEVATKELLFAVGLFDEVGRLACYVTMPPIIGVLLYLGRCSW